MLYDGYLLHMEVDERVKMETAYPELDRKCQNLKLRVTGLMEMTLRWSTCFKLVLTEVWSDTA